MTLANIILGDIEYIGAVEAGSLIVSVFASASRGLNSSPGVGTLCCVLAQDSYNASLHPDVQMGASEFNAGGNPVMDKHPIRGRVFTPSHFVLQKQKIH